MNHCWTKSKICLKTDLAEGERIDEIGFGGLRLIQNAGEFCYGIDAVLLAWFASGARISIQKAADLGTGSGVIPLMLSHMTGAKEILGIEVQESSFGLACRNVSLNQLEDRIHMHNGDVSDWKAFEPHFATVDMVVTNPPYVKKSSGIPNQIEAKRIARHETTAELLDFIRLASLLLKNRGSFCIVFRPERLVELCVACQNHKLEPKTIQLVSPNSSKAPNLLLMHCVKYGRSELKWLSPLYVYEEDGSYTARIREIYEKV